MELEKVKIYNELKQSIRLETENGNKAAKSIALPYNYLSRMKGKGLRSKLMLVSEFPFEKSVLNRVL